MELNKNRAYYLGDLTETELKELWQFLVSTDSDWSDCKFEEVEEEQIENELLPEIKEQFYFNQSKHGPNFYRILETIQVKNEYHDWREYYKYEQLGSGKIFHKPVDMFEKEFKKVEIG